MGVCQACAGASDVSLTLYFACLLCAGVCVWFKCVQVCDTFMSSYVEYFLYACVQVRGCVSLCAGVCDKSLPFYFKYYVYACVRVCGCVSGVCSCVSGACVCQVCVRV